MREIKFRAWDGEKMCDNFSVGAYGEIIMGGEEYPDWSLMSFTGKKDSTGKEIYEGDIIEFDEKEWGGKDNIHVVSWDEKEACWCWGGGSTSDMEWRRVIGNIYETSVLLNRNNMETKEISTEEKAKMIADQCKPCSKEFYDGVYQGIKIALEAELKND